MDIDLGVWRSTIKGTILRDFLVPKVDDFALVIPNSASSSFSSATTDPNAWVVKEILDVKLEDDEIEYLLDWEGE
jgi:hypothetical protein